MAPRTFIEEIFGLLIEFLFEILFQGIVELIGWLIGTIGRLFGATATGLKIDPELKRALAVGFFALCGAGLGALSLWPFPNSYIETGWMRWVNLFLSPVAGGLLMVGLEGLLRRDPKKRAPDLELFARGALFCFFLALVRLVWAR